MSRPQPTSARLLISLLPWVIVGGALIYLSPQLADLILHLPLTHKWLETLSHTGYYPKEAAIAAGIATASGIVFTVQGNGQLRDSE